MARTLTYDFKAIRFLEVTKLRQLPSDPYDICRAVSKYICKQYGIKPSEINQGFCYFWSTMVHALLPETTFRTTYSHIWLIYKGSILDSHTAHNLRPKPRRRLNHPMETTGVRKGAKGAIAHWLEEGRHDYSFSQFIKHFVPNTTFPHVPKEFCNERDDEFAKVKFPYHTAKKLRSTKI